MKVGVECALCLLICVIPTVVGYSSGAPSAACAHMIPRHGTTSPQTGESPFSISLSTTSYACNEEVTVTLRSSLDSGFKGFFCQPRSDANNPTTTGTLTSLEPSIKTTSNCDASVAAITHGDNSVKRRFRFKWTPARNESTLIVCSVVQSFNVYWAKQVSDTITYAGCSAASSTSAPGSTSGPTTTPSNGGDSIFSTTLIINQIVSMLFCMFICLFIIYTN